MVQIVVGDCRLERKPKFRLVIKGVDGEREEECISAHHASVLLKGLGYSLSMCDIYNKCNTSRAHKRLAKRWPESVLIEKLGNDARRAKKIDTIKE